MNNYTLMTPGPVPLPDWVLKELALPVLHHRTTEFEVILDRVLNNLKKLFQTQQHCFVLASVGTGAMEAALLNTIEKGETVLVIDAGKFGNRWLELAKSFQLKPVHMQIPWGQDLDLNKVSEILKNHPQIRAILCQACETSTGAQLPVEALARFTRDTDRLVIVDAVTALGAYDVPMDRWGLDVVITGSQKALMLPTGLSLISLSEKAWSRAEKLGPRQSFYFDLVGEKKANDSTQTRWSSAVSLIRALDVVLKYIETQGMQKHFAEIAHRAEHFRKEVLNDSLKIFPQTPSPSLTALEMPKDIESQKVQKILQDQYKIIVMAGQDAYKNRLIRVGHMGAMSLDDLSKTAKALHQAMEQARV